MYSISTLDHSSSFLSTRLYFPLTGLSTEGALGVANLAAFRTRSLEAMAMGGRKKGKEDKDRDYQARSIEYYDATLPYLRTALCVRLRWMWCEQKGGQRIEREKDKGKKKQANREWQQLHAINSTAESTG